MTINSGTAQVLLLITWSRKKTSRRRRDSCCILVLNRTTINININTAVYVFINSTHTFASLSRISAKQKKMANPTPSNATQPNPTQPKTKNLRKQTAYRAKA